MSSVVGAR